MVYMLNTIRNDFHLLSDKQQQLINTYLRYSNLRAFRSVANFMRGFTQYNPLVTQVLMWLLLNEFSN